MFGERLALDLDNAFYAVAEDLINSFREQNDHDGFRLAAIVNFGIDTNITADEFAKGNDQQLAEKLYLQAVTNYDRKKQEMMVQAIPVFKISVSSR